MRPTRRGFRESSIKTIALIGMSGAGKTHIGAWLSVDGWRHYSCDLVIAERHLTSVLPRPASRDDLRPVSEFIGKVGAASEGGLPLDEFKKRQALYNAAECETLREAAALAGGANLVIDTTGSFCEITDETLIDAVGRASLIVYLKTAPEDVAELIARQRAYPKPLYFPPAHFARWLTAYMMEKKIDRVDGVPPDDFSRWVFPRLIESRLPKYQALADRYGVTISAASLRGVATGDEFLRLLEAAL